MGFKSGEGITNRGTLPSDKKPSHPKTQVISPIPKIGNEDCLGFADSGLRV